MKTALAIYPNFLKRQSSLSLFSSRFSSLVNLSMIPLCFHGNLWLWHLKWLWKINLRWRKFLWNVMSSFFVFGVFFAVKSLLTSARLSPFCNKLGMYFYITRDFSVQPNTWHVVFCGGINKENRKKKKNNYNAYYFPFVH